MDISHRKKIEKEIQNKNQELTKSLREKDTLLRELYHRTKNTMQLISSLISLQSHQFSENKDITELICLTNQRIQAISLVHKMLYEAKDLSKISMKLYIEDLCNLILQGFGKLSNRIKIDLQVDDLFFLIDTAIPFGIILNELMTNSLKYAFSDREKGMINIKLNKDESDNFVFAFKDDGIGLPDEFNPKNNNSLGFNLIYSIGEEQLGGEITIKSERGFSFKLILPQSLYKVRV
jgi:two-component sensor histidine kinase